MCVFVCVDLSVWSERTVFSWFCKCKATQTNHDISNKQAIEQTLDEKHKFLILVVNRAWLWLEWFLKKKIPENSILFFPSLVLLPHREFFSVSIDYRNSEIYHSINTVRRIESTVWGHNLHKLSPNYIAFVSCRFFHEHTIKNHFDSTLNYLLSFGFIIKYSADGYSK